MPPVFAVDSSTGALVYTGGAAVNGSGYTLYVQASDGLGSRGDASDVVDATVPVSVRVENREPSFISESYSHTLASGRDGSVVPVAVGTLLATDSEDHDLVYSLRAADPPERMYMTSVTSAALYTLDSTTSDAVRVGTAPQFGVSENLPLGLAWHNGQLYMTGSGTNGLYTLDVVTGEATPVASKDQIIGRFRAVTPPGRGVSWR